MGGECSCTRDSDCDDDNACTEDECVDDTCDYTPIDCDDGLFCNGRETCDTSSGCKAGSLNIDDGFACTIDKCDESGDFIMHVLDNSICEGGMCNPTMTSDPSGCVYTVECRGENICEDYLSLSGCMHDPCGLGGCSWTGNYCFTTCSSYSDCEDTNPCTAGYCKSGRCLFPDSDLNFDGKVNIFDLLMLLAGWGDRDLGVDMNFDDIVNLTDILILISVWGNTC